MMRKALWSDLDEIMGIVEKTIEDMKEAKNFQWNSDYPTRDIFADDTKNGELFILEGQGGSIGGMICVNFDEPPEYSGLDWSYNKKAVILHRLVVSSAEKGQGIGSKLMEFAEQKAAEMGADYLKSDTYSTNKQMNALFRKMGYKYIGDTYFPGRELEFYCYEKILTKDKSF
jgi:GNAT superfamily N-acetyltransferase